MTNFLFVVVFLLFAFAVLPTAGTARADTVGDGGARNPVLWADVPDPSMIRVGDTYFMSSTTNHFTPGLPLMQSRDLVNWRIVAYAYDTLGDSDALALRSGKNDYGNGSWASSLRFHDGTFFVTTFSHTTGKTYVFRTHDIAKGPWKRTEFAPALHDHSLFFDDDGRVYMVHGSGDLRLVELTADVSGIKPGGINQVIVPNATAVAGPNPGLPAEGSQLFKHDGKYYLFSITWPKNGMRTELVFRADKITGPYEGRVAFADWGVAQGGVIDTPGGDWYAYLFQDHGAVGRAPFLIPVKWKNGWPVIGDNGKLPAALRLPARKEGVPGVVASDDFDRPATVLAHLKKSPRAENNATLPGAFPLAWQWNHNPDNRYWSLTERPGWLRLTNGSVDATLTDAHNLLTQRMFGPDCAGMVALDTSRMKDGDVAGLAAFQKYYGYVGVKRTGDTFSVVMVNAGSGTPVEVAAVPLAQKTIYLRVEADFTDRADRAFFAVSLDGKTWQPIGDALKMTYTIPHFVGYRFALFNVATQSAGGFADFDFFHVSHREAATRKP